MSEIAKPAATGGKQKPSPPIATRFKPGVSANPGGRPVGSRNRLQGDFMRGLADDFEKHGKKTIEKARVRDPMGYVKMIASLMPKELEISRPLDDISDDQLNAAICAVQAVIAAQSGHTQAQPDIGSGTTATGQPQPA